MKVDLIQFSVDAATKETHESIRLHSKFDRVTERIALLCKKVEQSGQELPACHMNFTMSQENIHETRQFVELAASLGVRDISFRYMVVFEGGVYGEEDKIDSLGTERLISIGDEILEEGKKLGVTVHLDPMLTRESQKPRLCMRPWMDAFVDVFGNLYPCCLVTQRNDDMSQYVLGNLLEERFEDIWNGETYRQLRAEMAHPTTIPSICDGCVMLKKENGCVAQSSVIPSEQRITTSENIDREDELVQISVNNSMSQKGTESTKGD